MRKLTFGVYMGIEKTSGNAQKIVSGGVEQDIKLAYLYNRLREVQNRIAEWKINTDPNLRKIAKENKDSELLTSPNNARKALIAEIKRYINEAGEVASWTGDSLLAKSLKDSIVFAKHLREDLADIQLRHEEAEELAMARRLEKLQPHEFKDLEPHLDRKHRNDALLYGRISSTKNGAVSPTYLFEEAQKRLRIVLESVDFGYGAGAIPTIPGLEAKGYMTVLAGHFLNAKPISGQSTSSMRR